jgi:hypothetical protein
MRGNESTLVLIIAIQTKEKVRFGIVRVWRLDFNTRAISTIDRSQDQKTYLLLLHRRATAGDDLTGSFQSHTNDSFESCLPSGPLSPETDSFIRSRSDFKMPTPSLAIGGVLSVNSESEPTTVRSWTKLPKFVLGAIKADRPEQKATEISKLFPRPFLESDSRANPDDRR